MKKISFVVMLALIAGACRKQGVDNSDTHLLGFFSDRLIKIDQTAEIYDSTAFKDSIDFVRPPSNRTYVWHVSPDNGGAVWGGYFANGLATVAFSRPGIYQVNADIYDSSSHNLAAHTNTVSVQVGKDTLFPYYRIDPDDVLVIRPGFFTTRSGAGPAVPGMQLICSTTKTYDYSEPYLQLVNTSSVGNNDYSFVFSDSLRLATYPFTIGYNFQTPVQGVLEMPGFTAGMTAGIHIIWLGQRYSGTMTLTSTGYNLNWDNSGAVKFSN